MSKSSNQTSSNNKHNQYEIKPRRLFIDIEVSPNEVRTWRIGYKINISHESIIKERAIICVCWSWEDEQKIHELHWDSKQSDRTICQKLAAILDSADEIIGHNVKRFDLPWLKTRMIKWGVGVNPFIKVTDTLKIAKDNFLFNSNKLDYIGKFLGIGEKIKNEPDLWDKVLDNDKESLGKMVEYCKQDVNLLKGVYNEMAPYIKATFAVQPRSVDIVCPHCNSTRLQINQNLYTSQGSKRITYKCKDCNKYHSRIVTKTMMNEGILNYYPSMPVVRDYSSISDQTKPTKQTKNVKSKGIKSKGTESKKKVQKKRSA